MFYVVLGFYLLIQLTCFVGLFYAAWMAIGMLYCAALAAAKEISRRRG